MLDLRTMTTEEGVPAAQAAIVAYLEAGAPRGRTLAQFVRECIGMPEASITVAGTNRDGLPISRVIDRALQKLRKNCRIDYHKKEWWLLVEAK